MATFPIQLCRSLYITIPEDKEEIDMHYAEQVWANKAKEEGILIGEERRKAEERQKNIGTAIDMCYSLDVSRDVIANQMEKRFQLSHEEAMALVDKRIS